MGDYAVGMVAEDVFAGGGEFGGAVETRGEVGGEEGPDGGAAEAFGAVGELAGDGGAAKEAVDEVGEEEGPEDGDGAEEEEEGEEACDGEAVHEYCECLEASLEWDVGGCPSDLAALPALAGLPTGDQGVSRLLRGGLVDPALGHLAGVEVQSCGVVFRSLCACESMAIAVWVFPLEFGVRVQVCGGFIGGIVVVGLILGLLAHVQGVIGVGELGLGRGDMTIGLAFVALKLVQLVFGCRAMVSQAARVCCSCVGWGWLVLGGRWY